MAAPMMSAMSFESVSYAPIEDENSYDEMTNTELACLVKGIYEVMESIDESIDNGHENAENLVEAKEFLADVLSDIKASQQ